MPDCEIHPNCSTPHEYREDFEQVKAQIPSYKMRVGEYDELWERIDNLEDFYKLASMGWTSVENFTKDTGLMPEEVIGKYFQIAHDRVYFTTEE